MSEMTTEITEPIMLDETGQRIANALEGDAAHSRVSSLTGTPLASGGIVEAIGIPIYVEDVSKYAEYGLTEKGWYIFARIMAKGGTLVTARTTITGAAGAIQAIGNPFVDIAVRFGVAAVSQKVVIDWGPYVDAFVFKATDLAVRNLDYRSTFYVYDISPFTTWTFGESPDNTFAENKAYYIRNAEEAYEKAVVTAGDPAIYYELAVDYALTADTTFQEGKTYYILSGEEYTEATVTPGEAVTADTYYEQVTTYVRTADTEFAEGKTYYTTSDGTAYTEATVTVGDPIYVYYVHTKLSFAGMTRNVTYRLDEMVDCPIEITLPIVPDDGYGAWFEIQMRFDNTYSITLLPTDPNVKIGTATTQAQSAGINVVDLQYTDVDDIQMWTLLNTHSNLPAAT